MVEIIEMLILIANKIIVREAIQVRKTSCIIVEYSNDGGHVKKVEWREGQ